MTSGGAYWLLPPQALRHERKISHECGLLNAPPGETASHAGPAQEMVKYSPQQSVMPVAKVLQNQAVACLSRLLSPLGVSPAALLECTRWG
jgi:hypothetical protein